MSTVACIITSFNNGQFLTQAVESVLSQTHCPEEIIIADDGSTDGSRAILENLAARHSNIKLQFRDKNLGVSANRDLAIRSAKAMYVTTLDGDDIYYPEKIAKELELMNDELDVVAFSNVTHIDVRNKPIEQLDHAVLAGLGKLDRLRYLLYRQGHIPRDMMYSKQLFEHCGGFRHGVNMFEDWDLKMRLAYATGRWRHNNQECVGYRRHERGLSGTDPLTHLTWQLNAILSNREWLSQALGKEEVYNAILARIANNLGYRSIQLIP